MDTCNLACTNFLMNSQTRSLSNVSYFTGVYRSCCQLSISAHGLLIYTEQNRTGSILLKSAFTCCFSIAILFIFKSFLSVVNGCKLRTAMYGDEWHHPSHRTLVDVSISVDVTVDCIYNSPLCGRLKCFNVL